MPPTTPPAIAPTGVDEPPPELLLAREAEFPALEDEGGTVVNSVMVDRDVALETVELEEGGVCQDSWSAAYQIADELGSQLL